MALVVALKVDRPAVEWGNTDHAAVLHKSVKKAMRLIIWKRLGRVVVRTKNGPS